MFVIPKKPRLFELQSVVHFLIVASSLTYGYGANSTKTFCQNLDGDPVAKILGRGSRRPRQVEKLQNQAGDRNTHSIPKPILVLGEKKAVYLTCQPSSTIH